MCILILSTYMYSFSLSILIYIYMYIHFDNLTRATMNLCSSLWRIVILTVWVSQPWHIDTLDHILCCGELSCAS